MSCISIWREIVSVWIWDRNFAPKKFRRIDSKRFSLFRGRKCSFRGPRKSQFRSSEQNGITQKISLQKSQNNLTKWFVRTSKVHCSLFWRSFFDFWWLPSFEKAIQTKVSCFSKQNRERVFFCEMLQNKIPKFVFVPRNKFQDVSSSVEWFTTEFREFSVPRNSLNSAGTNHLFRRIFCRKFPTQEIVSLFWTFSSQRT